MVSLLYISKNVLPLGMANEIEQNQQNIADIKELADYYGGWDQLRKVIDQIEANEAEEAYEKHTSGGSDAWSGGFAKNH